MVIVPSLAQSYSLTYETAGLDTWNDSTQVANGVTKAQVTLPFSFNFFGTSYSSVWVNANGFIAPAVDLGANPTIGESNFRKSNMIAVFWGGSFEVLKNEYSDRVVFTFNGNYLGWPVTAQAVFYSNGDFRLRYSSINQVVVDNNASIITGVSKGDDASFYHNDWGTTTQTAYYKYVPPAAATTTTVAAKLAPQIINFTSTANVTKRSQTVDFLFGISDDVSVDPNAISVSIVPKEGKRVLIGSPVLRSGNEKTGVYNLTWKVPNNITQGLYDIKVFVCDSAGNCNIAATAGNLTINATLYFNLNDKLKDSYNQTEEIKLSGEVVDFLNNRVKANVTLDLIYPGGKYTFKNATEFGRYVLNYRTSLLDVLGNWTIELKATDADGNEGTLVKKVTLRQPQAFFYYSVVFLSPVSDATYYRGENARISVKVLDLDKPVGDAVVNLKLPTGELIQLNEVSPGTGIYQSSYRIKFKDQTGNWTLGVEGLKQTEAGLFAGSNSIGINVRHVDLIIDILSPDKNRFTINENVKIKVKVTYPDNSLASGITLNATPVKKALALVETEPGIYEAKYRFSQQDEGRRSLRIFALDPYDNLAFVEKSIFVVQPTIVDFLMQLWYITVPGIGVVLYLVARTKSPTIMLKYYNQRLKNLENLKKSTQEKYFVGDGIDEPTFRRLVQDTDRKVIEVKTKIKDLEARIVQQKQTGIPEIKAVGTTFSNLNQSLEKLVRVYKRGVKDAAGKKEQKKEEKADEKAAEKSTRQKGKETADLKSSKKKES
ncbi:MAG: hypothetical protein HYT70_02535 [Candidatus Aenigmarchaeota archaeon]|nr:hypothetical protein [Candidatus Aenigmarchaeota archaeon]